MTRQELQAVLWPDTTVDYDHGLNKAVSKIREALGDSAEKPRYIETLPRRGYRYIGPLEDAEAPGATAEKADDAGDSGTNDLLVSNVLRTNELQVWFLSEHLVAASPI